MTGYRILLVGGDALLRQSLRERLEAEGFSVGEADDAEAGLAAATATRPDAIVVDSTPPDLSRPTFRAALRNAGAGAAILALLDGTAGDGDGKDHADDRLTKPFRMGALLARLRALLLRHGRADATIRIGPYRFQPAERLMIGAGDRRIRLTDKETAILTCLHRADRAIARQTLLREVWGYGPDVATHTLETHIYRLRRKIEDDPADARILVTEPGGYRLMR